MKQRKNLSALVLTFVLLLRLADGRNGHECGIYSAVTHTGACALMGVREPLFLTHLPATMLCTGIGLVVSIVLGILLAVLMDANAAAEKMLYPIIIASQTIPTTALAPLFTLWFGYTIWSKVLVTVLITFSRLPLRYLTDSVR